MDKRLHTIYSLSDPRTGEVRYVGKSSEPDKRYLCHLSAGRGKPEASYRNQTHCARWIRGLLAAGVVPVMATLEVVDSDWPAAEKKWIADFRARGYSLTNDTDGGEGTEGYTPGTETRELMAAAKRGRKQSPEAIEARVSKIRGKKRPPEVVARIVASRGEYHHTEETKAVLKEKCSGRPHTKEERAKISVAGKGRVVSEETRAKMRAAKAGKPLSAEHRAKLSEAAHHREPMTEEHKAKIKAACPQGWKHTSEAIAKITEARRARADRERLWCSPHCLGAEVEADPRQVSMFDGDDD
jgi:hypothetical protein